MTTLAKLILSWSTGITLLFNRTENRGSTRGFFSTSESLWIIYIVNISGYKKHLTSWATYGHGEKKVHLLNSNVLHIRTYHVLRLKAELLALCISGALGCLLTQCQGGKKSAMILKKRAAEIPNNLESILQPIIHKWQTFATVANLPWNGQPRKFISRHLAIIRETRKKPQSGTS